VDEASHVLEHERRVDRIDLSVSVYVGVLWAWESLEKPGVMLQHEGRVDAVDIAVATSISPKLL
jgi:hypothetical protein